MSNNWQYLRGREVILVVMAAVLVLPIEYGYTTLKSRSPGSALVVWATFYLFIASCLAYLAWNKWSVALNTRRPIPRMPTISNRIVLWAQRLGYLYAPLLWSAATVCCTVHLVRGLFRYVP